MGRGETDANIASFLTAIRISTGRVSCRQELLSDRHLLSEEQTRVVEKYVRDGRLNGLELRGSDLRKFKLHSSRLRKEQAEFIGELS